MIFITGLIDVFDIKVTYQSEMVVAPKTLLQKVGDLLNVDGYYISPSVEVCNLGVILDSTLSF